MRTPSVRDRNRLLEEAAGLEALDDLNRRLIPELERTLHASFVFAYRAWPDAGRVKAYLPAATPDLIATYFAEYVTECPLHSLKDRLQGEVLPTTAHYGFDRLRRTRVYNELWRPWGFDHHVALRFDRPEVSVGVIINRDQKRGEYSKGEVAWLRALSEGLGPAMRRAARLEELQDKLQSLEALLEVRGGPEVRLVIGAADRLVHVQAPPGLEQVVEPLRDPRHPLRQEARRLLGGDPRETPLELEQVLKVERRRWRASLQRLTLPKAQEVLVVIGLSPLPAGPGGALTPGEELVLTALSEGLSNVEIGRRLYISPETVRTHLTRIYKKLGVRSRLEAAVKAGVRRTA